MLKMLSNIANGSKTMICIITIGRRIKNLVDKIKIGAKSLRYT
jgi:hypothetical protein